MARKRFGVTCLNQQINANQRGGRLRLRVGERFVEVRSHRTGADNGYVNSKGSELVVEAFTQPVQRELRGAVAGYVQGADLACDGGDIHDMPAASRDHRRQSFVRTVNHAEVVGSHQFFDDLDVRFGERPTHADTGVVDENVDLAEFGENPGNHFANLIELTHVAQDGGG